MVPAKRTQRNHHSSLFVSDKRFLQSNSKEWHCISKAIIERIKANIATRCNLSVIPFLNMANIIIYQRAIDNVSVSKII